MTERCQTEGPKHLRSKLVGQLLMQAGAHEELTRHCAACAYRSAVRSVAKDGRWWTSESERPEASQTQTFACVIHGRPWLAGNTQSLTPADRWSNSNPDGRGFPPYCSRTRNLGEAGSAQNRYIWQSHKTLMHPHICGREREGQKNDILIK